MKPKAKRWLVALLILNEVRGAIFVVLFGLPILADLWGKAI